MVFLTLNCSDRGPRGRADPIRGLCREQTGGQKSFGKKNMNWNCVILEKSVTLIYRVWKKKCHLISHFHLSAFMNLVFIYYIYIYILVHLDENKLHSHCVPICHLHPPCPPSEKHPWKKKKTLYRLISGGWQKVLFLCSYGAFAILVVCKY